jgi:hypothetical protein
MSIADLQNVISTLESLTPKVYGDLIKHNEWNDVINHLTTVAQELNSLNTRVDNLQTYTGYEEGAAYTLRGRIEALEEFVGTSSDTENMATLSGRVTKLEQTDVVEQEEFDTFVNDEYTDFKDSVEPLRGQYLVSLQTTQSSYNVGERAVLTATVRTLSGAIPSNRPWVDFITSWGKLSAFDGFTTHAGIDGHSISVRCDANGVAKIRASSEQIKGLTEEDEAQVEGFFDTMVQSSGKSVRQVLNESANSSGDNAAIVYGEMKKVYQRANAKAMQKFADNYYASAQNGYYQGGIHYGGNWNYYRSTVVAIAREDGDPTTPDSKSAASAIQISFKDWVGPWVDWYVEDDALEYQRMEDLLGSRMDPDIYVTLFNIQDVIKTMDKGHGIIQQNKTLNAAAKYMEQVDIPVDPRVAERAKDSVLYGLGTQKSWNIATYSMSGADMYDNAKQTGFNAVMNQAVQLSSVDILGGDVNDLKDSVSTLQDTSSTIGNQVLGSMSDMQSKIVEFNVPQREILMNNIENIRGQVTEILGKFNQS